MRAPLIVTLTKSSGKKLAAGLDCARVPYVWWPAFRIQPCAELDLSCLDGARGVFFSSPSAIDIVRGFCASWPKGVPVYAPGEESAIHVKKAWTDIARVFYPHTVSTHNGSLALYKAFSGSFPSPFLIFHGEGSRLPLKGLLEKDGIKVWTRCVYKRSGLKLDKSQAEQLSAWARLSEPPTILFASEGAAQSVIQAFSEVPSADSWLKSGTAVTMHENIASALKVMGFSKIACLNDFSQIIPVSDGAA